jgi:hypothetical protein
VYPGGLTAELWHVLAALHLDRRLRLYLPWAADSPKEAGRAAAALELLSAVGLGQRVVAAPASGAIGHEEARRLAVESGHIAPDTVCGHGWAATSIVSSAAVRGSRQLVVGALRDTFERGQQGSPEFHRHRADYDEHCLGWLDELRPGRRYVLVNMRWIAGHGPYAQHNITALRFEQIVQSVGALATISEPLDVVRIGLPETWAHDACAWIGRYERDTLAADPYRDRDVDSPLWTAIGETRLFQPYFWRRVADLAAGGVEVVGMIGGRSASMDIAAFMGVRTATWDRVAPDDHDYMRLHWSAPFHSIIRDDVEAGLDADALRRWLQGEDLVPVLATDRTTGSPVGTLDRYGSERASFEGLWYP